MGGSKLTEHLRIPTPSGSAIVIFSEHLWDPTAPRFYLCPGPRDATSHLVKMANLEEDASKHSKGAPIGSRL